METNYILMTKKDHLRISNLLRTNESGDLDALELEMDRAKIIEDEEAPADLVTMNSTCTFRDVETEIESTVTLVYPQDVDIEAKKISILAPLGSALIGLRVNQKIDWPLPNGKTKKLQIINVSYQPELAGDMYL